MAEIVIPLTALPEKERLWDTDYLREIVKKHTSLDADRCRFGEVSIVFDTARVTVIEEREDKYREYTLILKVMTTTDDARRR